MATMEAERTATRHDTPSAAHMAFLRQFAESVAERDGETLADLLAGLTPDLGPRARLGVALDACEALVALVADDRAALARTFGAEMIEEGARDPHIRASVAFALMLAHRLGFGVPVPDDDARLTA